jgi:hypothetical protein
MTTATGMTMQTSASHSTLAAKTLTLEERVEDEVSKLKNNLNRYARTNDRRMTIRSIKDVKFLACLPMDPVGPPSGPLKDMEIEVAEESIVVNGVPFKNVGYTVDGKSRKSNSVSNSIVMLKGLCDSLCQSPGVTVSSDTLYKSLITRMVRTTSSADAYFRLNPLMGSSDLLVMPVVGGFTTAPKKTESGVVRGPASSDTAGSINPIQLNLYVTDGNVHMTLSATFAFGLFRKSDVKSGRPWIEVQALVNERTNFSNQQSVRHMSVNVPNQY